MRTRAKESGITPWLHHQRQRLLEALCVVGKTMEQEEEHLKTMGTWVRSDLLDTAEEECEDQEVAQTLPSIRARYEGIIEALRGMDEGVYGICVDCGDPIPKRRLQSLPSAVRCIPCEEAWEKLSEPAAARETSAPWRLVPDFESSAT